MSGIRASAGARAGVLFLGLAALAGCGGTGHRALRTEASAQVPHKVGLGHVARTAPVRRQPRRVRRGCADGVRPLGSARVAYAVVARRPLVAYAAARHSRVLARFGLRDVNGYPVVFAVLAQRTGRSCRASWYRVRLPTAPTIANGSTGWIDSHAVRLFRVDSRIVVDLRRRRLRLYRGGRRALDVPVAVGAPGTPTPTGTFFVDERWVLSTEDGPFGPAALGISARSDVLTDWVEGGPVALHGTDEPQLIGTAASHGCVRLQNDAMRKLFALAPAGTPVVIRA